MIRIWLLVVFVAVAGAWAPADTSKTDRLAAIGLQKLGQRERPGSGGHARKHCTLRNAKVRREWSTLSKAERKDYIRAVKCLQAKPARGTALAPGAVSRFDDFVAVHINQTLTIHATGNFLSWHRYFTWTYEQALRNECGYKGFQPYINWGKYTENVVDSPVFDGSDTSMSGDGAWVPHTQYILQPPIVLPPGNGGGCVERGPFQDMVVRLGPLVPVLNDTTPNPQVDGLGLNPRCLRRDLNLATLQRAAKDSDSYDLIANQKDIASFQTLMQGIFPENILGVHTAGHYLVGADPGGDFFASPGDPYFYLHHGQIDRTWWIWQNQDLATRQHAIAGTLTLFNDPPSRNATLEDILDLGVNAETIRIKEAMSTLDGPFCYIYL